MNETPTPPQAESDSEASDQIARAVEILRGGGLVAFPTETVYGLGCDARNAEALARVFKIKGRPTSHPLIVHIASARELPEWVAAVPEAATQLARTFWPGPLTLVLEKKEGVLDAVTGGQDTIAVRVPSHPVALELLRAFGGGIAGPSANKFGHVSPTTPDHVRAEFGDEIGRGIELVLDGGPSDVGIESTIVDLSRGEPVLLRPGRIRAEEITAILGTPVDAPDATAPRAPGSHAAHYAPRAAMKIVPNRKDFTDELAAHRGRRIGVLALEISVPRVQQPMQRVLPASASLYAHGLYAKLRELDAAGADLILVEAPPKNSGWTAVWDRLRRAEHAHAHGTRPAGPDAPWKKRGKGAAAKESVEVAEVAESTESAAPGDEARPA